MKTLALAVAALWAIQATPSEPLLAKLDLYLQNYEPRLSELIADERMFQELKGTNVDQYLPADIAPFGRQTGIARRRLTSEVAFIALPGDAGWLGFRHVKSVNRKNLDDNRSLAAALGVSNLDPARELLNASAAHNLGLPRTTNLPNLPLEFLHRRNRHRFFTRPAVNERVRGVNAALIVLLEKTKPTLIIKPDGSDMPSVVRAWIDPRDGRLLRAEVRSFPYLDALTFDHSVRVEFEHNQKLGLLVPARMEEIFPGDPGKGTTTATYSNFRRFQTSARIVPQ